MPKLKSPTAIILTGGKSSRIGKDKSLLILQGKTLLDRVIDLTTQVFETTILSVAGKSQYPEISLEKVEDLIQGSGPLVGIYSALMKSESERNFVISCDMPFVNQNLVAFLKEYKSDKLVIIPYANKRLHPLCGIYSQKLLPYLKEYIEINIDEFRTLGKNKSLSLKNFLSGIPFEIINVEDKLKGYNSMLFFNINTIDDYKEAKRIISDLD